MKDRTWSVILILLFIVYLTGQLLLLAYPDKYLILNITQFASSGFTIISLLWLYVSGTFRYSRYARLGNLCIAAFLVSILFKLQHWAGASILLWSAMVVAFILYLLHFLQKEEKETLDGLKLAWVAIAAAGYIIKLERFAFGLPISLLSHCLLALIIALHIKARWNIQPPQTIIEQRPNDIFPV